MSERSATYTHGHHESVLRSLTVLYVPPELTQPQVDAEALAAAAEDAADE